MQGPVVALLPDGTRLHLQHGPIDLIVGADSAPRRAAFRAAAVRFETVLQELVDELPLLRSAPTRDMPTGDIARRMHRAVGPLATDTFVTPMAAVAGAVADEILGAMRAATPLGRAYVNNGGDIALHLGAGQSYRTAVAGLNNADLGRIEITARHGVGGIATSGMGGRSLSMGIADGVTVLAKTSAMADAAATLIANGVDLPGHPAITRIAANQIDPDSDLGGRMVVTHCAQLSLADVSVALTKGADIAQKMKARGLIIGAALFLQGSSRLVTFPALEQIKKVKEHA